MRSKIGPSEHDAAGIHGGPHPGPDGPSTGSRGIDLEREFTQERRIALAAHRVEVGPHVTPSLQPLDIAQLDPNRRTGVHGEDARPQSARPVVGQ